MRKSRFTEAQILAILGEGEASLPVAQVSRKPEIITVTYYQWKSKYSRMSVSELRRVKELEAENSTLNKNVRGAPTGERRHQGRAVPKVMTPTARRAAVQIMVY